MTNLSFSIKDIPEDLPLSFALKHYHVELVPDVCENCGEIMYFTYLDYYPEFPVYNYKSINEYCFSNYADALYSFLVLLDKAINLESDLRKEVLR